MGATVVQCFHFDIEGSQMAVAVLVLDARVGELDMSLVVRKLVLDGLAMDLRRGSIGPAVTI